MPRIINAAYDGNSALGDTLSRLGEAIYGDQAKNEMYRQKAFGEKRENDNAPLLADAVANGNRNDIARYGVMAGKTGLDAANYNLLSRTNHATGIDDPDVALAQLGAHEGMGNTAVGQGRQLQNAVTITGMNNATSLEGQRIASDRAAASQAAIDGRTLTPVLGDDGVARYQPKSQAVDGMARLSR
jgi:hypothetical protein